MKRHRKRLPVVLYQEVDIRANADHVVAVVELNGSTVGLRFHSPEHLLTFFTEMMKAAAKVWPENEWIKEYLADD